MPCFRSISTAFLIPVSSFPGIGRDGSGERCDFLKPLFGAFFFILLLSHSPSHNTNGNGLLPAFLRHWYTLRTLFFCFFCNYRPAARIFCEEAKFLKKQNRSSGRSKKLAKAILGGTIDKSKPSASVVKGAFDKCAGSKLGVVNNDCLFLNGLVTHYFHNVTSNRYRR